MIINLEEAKKYEIELKDMAVYYCLILHDGELSNKELRSKLGSSYGVTEISDICSKLEAKKLIKRYITKTNKVQYEILALEEKEKNKKFIQNTIF
ncbi:hypothetical protein DXA30_07985 [Fusobacterium ulcerans]|uniref:hypothetical protein n=1 Tax=Fusobacterium ulcerans TaxID=861 RepID=UPI000E473E7A|nr:hypothetical protein [Fusobacterium ulcerans]RGY64498.1 hypothetical protein DXA30_07985 [Fusobacterium ulcerans]